MKQYELFLPNHIPAPIREYKFHPTRRWRIDFCWPVEKLAVEIEGGCWIAGRHTRGTGFQKDMEKYNSLTLAGYSLLRFTPKQVRDGLAAELIAYWFEMRKSA